MSGWVRRLKRKQEQAAPVEVIREPDRRVVIASPMQDMCHTTFCSSLINMFSYTAVHSPPDLSIGFHMYGCSILQYSREMLGQEALKRNATHILWVDSDMEFPQETLLHLLKHDVDIVAANCIARRPPYSITARYESGEEVPTTVHSSGLEKVARIGFGLVLLKTDVLRAIPEPWFEFTWRPESNFELIQGEDVYFGEKAKAHGFALYIDHDVSKVVKHVGMFGYSPLFRQASEESNS